MHRIGPSQNNHSIRHAFRSETGWFMELFHTFGRRKGGILWAAGREDGRRIGGAEMVNTAGIY